MVHIDSQQAFEVMKKNLWLAQSDAQGPTAEIKVVPSNSTQDDKVTLNLRGYPFQHFFY